MRNATPRYAATPPPVAPSLSKTSCTEEPDSVLPAALATDPRSSPVAATATSQLTAVPRRRRRLRPACPPSSRSRGALWERSGTTLDPTSRRPASQTQSALSTAVKATIGTSGPGSFDVSGARCSTQPSGESHVSQFSPMPASPTMRSP